MNESNMTFRLAEVSSITELKDLAVVLFSALRLNENAIEQLQTLFRQGDPDRKDLKRVFEPLNNQKDILNLLFKSTRSKLEYLEHPLSADDFDDLTQPETPQ